MNTNTNSTDQAMNQAATLIDRNQALKEGCCLLSAKVSSPCGESTLPNAVVTLNGQSINSEQVKSSKLQWFPRSKLKLTTKYSNQISRILNAVGVKLGDMTVVPLTKLDDVQKSLDELNVQWKLEVDDVINNYDLIIDQHCAENQDVAHLIREHSIPAQQFRSRFKMRLLTPLALTPLQDEDDSALADELSENLWAEIAKEASKIYSSSWFSNYKPVSRVSQKIRNPINRVVNKMLDLSFLDESLMTVCSTITDVMRSLPSTGYIEKKDFDRLTRWMLVMSDEDKLRLHAENSTSASAFVNDVEVSNDAKNIVDAFIQASNGQTNTNTDVEPITKVEVEVEVLPEIIEQSSVNTFDSTEFGSW